MTAPDRRTKEQILQHPRWDPLIGDPKLDGASVDNLRILDDFMRYIEDRKIVDTTALTEIDFLAYDRTNKSSIRLVRLKRAMETIFAGHLSMIALRAAIRAKDRAYLGTGKGSASQPRRMEKSVPYTQLPQSWQDAFEDMEAGFDRNGEKPATTGMFATVKMKARQLLRSAREADLQDELSAESVRAYARDLRRRQVAPATLRASFSALLKFARFIGTEPEVGDLLIDLCRIYEAKAEKAPKQKFTNLQNTGYSPVALLDKAEKLFADANRLACPRARHAQRNRAAAIALFSVVPLRLADTRFVFDRTLLWTEGAYVIDTRMSKTGNPWTATIDTRLNPFIDALILRDCGPEWLDQMRENCLASRRALFITHDGRPVSYNYVSDCWRREIGTGEHIARTILHTFLGIELGQAGTDMAMSACGHVSASTAAAYQGDALAMAQRLKGQQELTEMIVPQDGEMFEFV